MNSSKPNFYNKPIDDKYIIQKNLKAGGFGYVYIASDIKQKNKCYAIKLMPMTAKKYADIQLNLYQLLQKHKVTTGFVKFYDNGIFMDHKYLLMELIGNDLQDLKKQSPKQKMSLKTVMMIGLQVIDRLEAFHRIGYIHRDVKPDNLGIGLYEKSKIIYLFDFGLAHPIGVQMPKQQKGKVIGTLGFMSCRAHEGKEIGRPDDIQSLIYTLLYLAQGTLPWLKLQLRSPADFHKILLVKRGLTKKSFKNQLIPDQLFKILDFVQKLKYSDSLDYLKLKFRFLQCLKSIGQENDFCFDWLTATERKKQPLSPLKKKNRQQSPVDERKQNKKLQVMNEQNQQLVQNQIYEVYKFMEDNEQKQKLGQNRKKNKSKSPNRKKQQKIKQKIIKQPLKKRPVSAANNKQKMHQIIQPWQKILKYESITNVSGPKIVINKTAKHKI